MAKNIAKEELNQLGILKSMVRVTGEIASGRMQKARDGVLYRRNYLEELLQVFYQAHKSFLHSQGKKAEKANRFTTLAHNGKTVAVFLSANTRLYGDLLQRTFELFFEDLKNNGSEATVVGKVGRDMLKARDTKMPVTYFPMDNEKIPEDEMIKLVEHLVPYEAIHVYYGKYINPVRQEAEEFTITADLPETEKSSNEPLVEYMYEPSLEQVLAFFESQIFSTMFEQTVIEAGLAKYAARFVAMDRAEQQIDVQMKKTLQQMRLVKHREDNKKQLNLMGPVVVRFKNRY